MRKFLILNLLLLVSLIGCLKKGGKLEPSGVLAPAPTAAEKKGGEEGMPAAGKKILMIIPPTDFRDEELARPKAVFEQAGALVAVASKGVSETTGMLGGKAAVDLDIAEAEAADYDAVVFVGGAGASVYFDDLRAQALAKDAHAQGKIVAAICIAPSTLANAGILTGKKATVSPSEAGNLQAKGGVYTQEPVVVDGTVVTASGPDAAEAFGQKIIELLSQE